MSHLQDLTMVLLKLGEGATSGVAVFKTSLQVEEESYHQLLRYLIPTWRHGRSIPQQEYHLLGCTFGACTSLLGSLYWFGGWDGSSFYNSLHRLDTTTLKWREIQPLNQVDGPMRKHGSGLVPFLQDKLAIFGGYGIPTHPTQPGVKFTKDTRYTDVRGWSNELHVFTITEGMWGQYYLHMMRDRQYFAVCSICYKEYLNEEF